MVYFMNLAASIVISYQFFKTYKDFSTSNFLNYIKQKELIKLIEKNQFPEKDIQRLESQVMILEKLIKSNIVINL